MKFSEAALLFATEAHRGQTRWNRKDPYITHPIRVADIVRQKLATDHAWTKFTMDEIEVMVAAGYTHDVAEDVEEYRGQYEKIFDAIIKIAGEESLHHDGKHKFLRVLPLLDKNNYENYLEFILAARSYRLASIVKASDIQDNLSDLKKGSMRDKYLLALHILKS